jgi:hypothetical protein
VSHCHSAGDLDQSCPPRPYLYLVITLESHHLPGPITPQEPRLASAQLSLPRPLLHCPAFNRSPVSLLPVSVCPLPLPCPLPSSSIYIDLQIDYLIPSTPSPGHPVHASPTNRTVPTAWLPAFPRRQRSPLQISDLVSIKLSRISASCYSPFQLHEFPKTVSAPTPPLLTKPAS